MLDLIRGHTMSISQSINFYIRVPGPTIIAPVLIGWNIEDIHKSPLRGQAHIGTTANMKAGIVANTSHKGTKKIKTIF